MGFHQLLSVDNYKEKSDEILSNKMKKYKAQSK